MTGDAAGAFADGFCLDSRPAPLSTLLAATWRSRQLIGILARKDFYVRYRRATFGLLWAAALPLVQAVALAFVISRFATFATDDDFWIFVLAGTVAWSTFSGIVGLGATAIVDGASLSTKIYFPRLVLPLVTVSTSAYGLAISLVLLAGATLVGGVGLGFNTLLLIPAGVLTLVLAASFALVLSALHVYFRDVRYLVQAALLVWFYVTPVIYPLGAIGRTRAWIEANPMTGVVERYRAATVGADTGLTTSLLWTGGWVAVLLVSAVFLHRRFDRVFVDLL
jgi:ABC-type polysaccharide/polyol phosphate export permease